MVTKDCIETAYCFFHQKERIYAYSTFDWQRDDIEYAIEAYVDSMNPALYAHIAKGNLTFLRNHLHFQADLAHAVEQLEQLLSTTETEKSHTNP